MSEENVDQLRAVYSEWAEGNFRAGGHLFALDITLDTGAPGQGPYVGLEGAQAFMGDFLAQWTRFWIEAERFEDHGDVILVTERQHGIGRGSGVEANQIVYAAWTFRNGLVVKVRWEYRRSQALAAAGLAE